MISVTGQTSVKQCWLISPNDEEHPAVDAHHQAGSLIGIILCLRAAPAAGNTWYININQMKKLPFIILVALLGACSERGQKDEPQIHQHTADSAMPMHFDNGKKWKADVATMNNVVALKTILRDSFRVEGKDGYDPAARVEAKVNQLVAQCTMKGEAHEVLHQWLNGFISGMKQLKQDKANQEQHRLELLKTTDEFFRYFE